MPMYTDTHVHIRIQSNVDGIPNTGYTYRCTYTGTQVHGYTDTHKYKYKRKRKHTQHTNMTSNINM